MRTIEEAWEIIEGLNNEAHDEAWDTWEAADTLAESDNEDDLDAAEVLREEASLEQASHFRYKYDQLNDEDIEVVKYWLKHDEDFREQFATYFGEEEFHEEFPDEEE
jgi:hypothetical protein